MQQVTKWREKRGMTQAELARAAGLTRGAICRLEGGTRLGSIDTWQAIGMVLRVDYRKLLPAPNRRR